MDWRVDGITGIPGGPRMKSLLLESVDADDEQITRGEILCMCRIMTTCLRSRMYRAHQVSPVSAVNSCFCLISISVANLPKRYYSFLSWARDMLAFSWAIMMAPTW